MTALRFVKYGLTVTAIALIFINWKMAIVVFLLASILHAIPKGPDFLMSVITGYLIAGGIAYIYFDWRIGIVLIIAGFLVAKFRIWGNKKNHESQASRI